ncbi:uncharacterized protein BXZ73DRAFT_98458 [Epithele typhae]|uniref:uncharacterized protein n=1 Tax=Epithele typhae TaxID=378194 RepID=UPI0020079A9A|nr:uncharacterized protein BXZ73DRAFT_98458 [Epithele typhae]KAH9941243.1 hypothetical protein BXZ73DRAFT_98458 [Epithele typhae]
MIGQMNASMSEVLEQFAILLGSVARTFEQDLNERMDNAHAPLMRQMEVMNELALRAGSRFSALEGSFGALEQVAMSLIGGIQESSAVLDLLYQHAVAASEKHVDLLRLSDTLSESLTDMLEQTHTRAREINVTMTAMKESLDRGTDDWGTTLGPWLQHAAVHILRVNPTLFQQPVFSALRATAVVVRALIALTTWATTCDEASRIIDCLCVPLLD